MSDESHNNCRWGAEFEVAFADYVTRLNNKEPLPLPQETGAWNREDVLIGKEEYLNSYEGGWMEDVGPSELHLPIAQWRRDGWPGLLFRGSEHLDHKHLR